MKKIILIGFCVFGLEITEAISENGIAKLKHLAYEEPLNAINMSVGNSMPIATEIDRIIDFGKTFLDKPYKYKGPCSWVMDCSGYIACIFSEFGYQMPHSTPSIASIVKDVNLTEVQKGDLLFFKGRDNNSNSVGHVSIVTEVTNGNIKMMHSCNRGIVIDEYQKMDYYKKRLIKAGRLPFVYESKLNTLEVSKQDSISIIGVGDMMLGTNFPSVSYLPPEDGKNILTPVKHILKNADITFGNLESVILSEGGTVKRCSNPDLCYAFRMPNHYVNYFKEAGFDVLSLANNHIGDFGTKGRDNTVRLLVEKDIKFAGITKYPFTTFEKDGIKYGFCAFAPNRGTISIHDSKNAIGIVQHLDSICDIVIVSFHGGAEGAAQTHITGSSETCYGENRGNPYKFSRTVIDAGADVVFGHGPHVTRAIDIYKGRFIAYSLGNFATYGRFNLRGVCGIAPIIKLFVNQKGEFLSGNIYSIKQIGRGGPIIDNDQMALNEIINLTKSDIPGSPIIIKKNGYIYKK